MLKLRRVEPDDCELFWHWANDAEVRAAALSSAPIPWKDHREWFTHKIGSQDSLILVAMLDKNVPIGQIRFDQVREGEAEISISIAREKRACGYGSQLILLGLEEAFGLMSLEAVHAFVKTSNQGSQRAFEKSGFTNLGLEKVKGCEVIHFLRLRGDGR